MGRNQNLAKSVLSHSVQGILYTGYGVAFTQLGHVVDEFALLNDANTEMRSRPGYDVGISCDFVPSAQEQSRIVCDDGAFFRDGPVPDSFIE